MRKRLRRLLVLLVVLLVVLGVAYALLATVLRAPGGPLASPERFTAVGARGVSVGEERTFFAPVLRNGSGQAVKLEKVVPLRTSRGIRVLGVRVVRGRPPGRGDLPGFPPRGGGVRLRKLDGAEVPGDGSVRVAVGVRVTKEGSHTIRGFRVEYRQFGLRREVTLKDEITVTSRP